MGTDVDARDAIDEAGLFYPHVDVKVVAASPMDILRASSLRELYEIAGFSARTRDPHEEERSRHEYADDLSHDSDILAAVADGVPPEYADYFVEMDFTIHDEECHSPRINGST